MRLWLCSLPAVLASLALVFCLSLAVALVCFSPVLPAVEGEEGSPMSLPPSFWKACRVARPEIAVVRSDLVAEYAARPLQGDEMVDPMETLPAEEPLEHLPMLDVLEAASDLRYDFPRYIPALAGQAYDLLRTKSGAPSPLVRDGRVDTDMLRKLMSDYLEKGERKTLGRFYKNPWFDYRSQFFWPTMDFSEISKWQMSWPALTPSTWLLVYRGRVKSPVNGDIRFVGAAHDVMVVRFNNKVALNNGRRIHCPGMLAWNQEQGGVVVGSVINVREEEVYPVEIAVLNSSGKCGGILMWEHVSENSVISEDGIREGKRLYLFSTDFNHPDREEYRKRLGRDVEWPEFDAEPPIWILER